MSNIALDITAGCCDNDISLPLRLFLPGSPFTGDESATACGSKLPRRKYRPTKDREALVNALVGWRETVLDQHPHRAVVTRRWILPNETITALSKVRASELHGPEVVIRITDRTEEWTAAYALDVYNVISRFDEEKGVRKLCTQVARSLVKKVRSAAWQRQTRKRYVENAERALIVAEDVLENITKLKKAAGKEKKRLLALDGTTADDMDRMKITIGARRSELRQDLANAV